jgi:hypothetical protein
MSLSPDGRSIATTIVNVRLDVWMLEGLGAGRRSVVFRLPPRRTPSVRPRQIGWLGIPHPGLA